LSEEIGRVYLGERSMSGQVDGLRRSIFCVSSWVSRTMSVGLCLLHLNNASAICPRNPSRMPHERKERDQTGDTISCVEGLGSPCLGQAQSILLGPRIVAFPLLRRLRFNRRRGGRRRSGRRRHHLAKDISADTAVKRGMRVDGSKDAGMAGGGRRCVGCSELIREWWWCAPLMALGV